MLRPPCSICARARRRTRRAAGLPADRGPAPAREIESGGCEAGARLPTIRELARELGVNRDTVALAYDALARGGRGRVDGRPRHLRRARPRGRGQRRPPFEPTLSPLGRAPARLRARARRASAARRRRGPDARARARSLALSGRRVPHARSRACSRDGGPELLLYGEPQGHARAARGAGGAAARAPASPRRTRRDRALPRREPGHLARAAPLRRAGRRDRARGADLQQRARGALAASGCAPRRCRCATDGPDLAALERALARPEVKALLHDPDLPQPDGRRPRRSRTGARCSRSRAALRQAGDRGRLRDGPALRRARRCRRSRRSTRRASSCTCSRSRSRSSRARASARSSRAARASDALLALKHATDLSDALPLQAALAELRRERRATTATSRGCAARCARAATRCSRRSPREMPEGARWTTPEGGYQVWVELPGEHRHARPARRRGARGRAVRAGLAVPPRRPRPSSGLRLSFALADEDAIRRGVAARSRAARCASGCARAQRRAATLTPASRPIGNESQTEELRAGRASRSDGNGNGAARTRRASPSRSRSASPRC